MKEKLTVQHGHVLGSLNGDHSRKIGIVAHDHMERDEITPEMSPDDEPQWKTVKTTYHVSLPAEMTEEEEDRREHTVTVDHQEYEFTLLRSGRLEWVDENPFALPGDES